jgi:hypothetical protein
MITAIYHMLKDGTLYQDLGPNYLNARHKEREQNRLIKRLADLGYVVELVPQASLGARGRRQRLHVPQERALAQCKNCSLPQMAQRGQPALMTESRPAHSGGVSVLLLRRAGAFSFSRKSRKALWSHCWRPPS